MTIPKNSGSSKITSMKAVNKAPIEGQIRAFLMYLDHGKPPHIDTLDAIADLLRSHIDSDGAISSVLLRGNAKNGHPDSKVTGIGLDVMSIQCLTMSELLDLSHVRIEKRIVLAVAMAKAKEEEEKNKPKLEDKVEERRRLSPKPKPIGTGREPEVLWLASDIRRLVNRAKALKNGDVPCWPTSAGSEHMKAETYRMLEIVALEDLLAAWYLDTGEKVRIEEALKKLRGPEEEDQTDASVPAQTFSLQTRDLPKLNREVERQRERIKADAIMHISTGVPLSRNPFSNEAWNMTEQGDLVKENHEKAGRLAREAGTTIGGPKPKK